MNGYAATSSSEPNPRAMAAGLRLSRMSRPTRLRPTTNAQACRTLIWPALLLYASGLFWTLGYDTLYAVQDMEDDALVGVKSSALRLGDRAPAAIRVFYLLCAALAVAAAGAAGLGPLFLPVAGLYALHLAWQSWSFRTGDGLGALRLFKSNREAGLILFAAMIAGLWRNGGAFWGLMG